MPIYEYKCPSCGSKTEHLQKMDAPPPLCKEESCTGILLTKLVSKMTFDLKGGGWAKDGYSG